MKTASIFVVCCVILYAIAPLTGFTHTQENIENPQWHLPEGTIARLGKGAVNGITYSPDGTHLVVASSLGLWVYDAQTSETLTLLTGHTDIVSSTAYSPDGTTLASGSWDNTIHLWNAQTGERKKTLSGHTDRVVSVAFSPDSTRLASGSWDSTIRLWNTQTGQPEAILFGHTQRVHTATFSPDGNLLASGDQDGIIYLWDVATKQTVARFTGHTKEVTAVVFSPDGTLLASASQDGKIRLWDIATSETLDILTGQATGMTAVVFSPDGTRLAGGAQNGDIYLWDTTTRQVVATLKEHTAPIHAITYSPDSTTLVSASQGGAIRLWDADTRQTETTISGHAATAQWVTYSPDGSMLASGSDDGIIRLWDADTQQLKTTLLGHTDQIRCVVFSPDGSTLASAGGRDYTARLWDVATGKVLAILRGHTGGVLSVAFSPDGNTLATAGGYQDNTIRLWDVDTGQTKAVLTGHTSWVRAVVFSPDGSTLASVSGFGDNTLRLWDVDTGHVKAILTGHTSWIQTVAFSPDGSTLASAGNDTAVRLWDTLTGETRAVLTGHTYEVVSVAFSHDGSTLASAGPRTVRLWNATTAHAIVTLTGDVYGTRSVVFSPDDSTLASTGTDGTVLLWDLSALRSETDALQTAISQIQQQQKSEQPQVKVVYFYPNDREPHDIQGQADRIIKDVQVFYAREMQRHGYGIKTFTYAADPTGNIFVHRVQGQLPTADYQDNPYGKILTEIGKQFDLSQNIYLVFLEVGGEFLGRDVCGLGGTHGTTGGTAMFPAVGSCYSFRIVAHELAHALGIYHDHREPNLMSGSTGYLSRLSECAARFLDKHPIFNARHAKFNIPPTIQRLPPIALPSADIRIRFAVTHQTELHQVQLFTEALPLDPLPGTKLLACQPLNSKTATFEFPITQLTATPTDPISLQIIDTDGNSSWVWYPNAIDGLVQLDINGDGALNILDVVSVASRLGQAGVENEADLNGDNTVSVLDLVFIVGWLGATAAAPSAQHLALDSTFTHTEIQAWLTEAQQLAPTDAVSQRGIALFAHLLTELTPKETRLLPNYPNPFNPETWIPYQLAAPADVTLRLYSVTGTLVRTLKLGHRHTGIYQDRNRAAYWDGKNDQGEPVASGIYFYTLTAGDFIATRRMLIRK